jgi:hypothetical protein
MGGNCTKLNRNRIGLDANFSCSDLLLGTLRPSGLRLHFQDSHMFCAVCIKNVHISTF